MADLSTVAVAGLDADQELIVALKQLLPILPKGGVDFAFKLIKSYEEYPLSIKQRVWVRLLIEDGLRGSRHPYGTCAGCGDVFTTDNASDMKGVCKSCVRKLGAPV